MPENEPTRIIRICAYCDEQAQPGKFMCVQCEEADEEIECPLDDCCQAEPCERWPEVQAELRRKGILP